MRLEWIAREGAENVWDARTDENVLTVIGGSTFGCAINGKSIGQRGTRESAQEWCEHIAVNLPPRERSGELHLWTIMDYPVGDHRFGSGRYIDARVYGDRRFTDGKQIKTGAIVEMRNDVTGDYVTTRNPTSLYLLAPPERTAALILKGFEAERDEDA